MLRRETSRPRRHAVIAAVQERVVELVETLEIRRGPYRIDRREQVVHLDERRGAAGVVPPHADPRIGDAVLR